MIKNEFQQRLIMNTLLITLITLNVILLTAFRIEDLFGPEFRSYNVFTITVVVLEFVAVLAVYIIGRKISFRIAGPLFSMERRLREMNKGDLTESVRLRADDEFADIADIINSVMANYKGRLARMQSIAADSDAPPEQQLQLLRSELEWFKTTDWTPTREA